jgi:hypothetical protein
MRIWCFFKLFTEGIIPSTNFCVGETQNQLDYFPFLGNLKNFKNCSYCR